MTKADNQLRRILRAIDEAFHALPSALWTPTFDEEDGKQDAFWLLQERACARQLSPFVAVWSATGKWPLLDERSAYFLRVRLESARRTAASRLHEDSREEGLEIPLPDSGDIEVIRKLLLEDWTEELAHEWAARAGRYGAPPEVFLPLPRESPLDGTRFDDRVSFPFPKKKE